MSAQDELSARIVALTQKLHDEAPFGHCYSGTMAQCHNDDCKQAAALLAPAGKVGEVCPSCTWRGDVPLENGVCPRCKVNWKELEG